MQATVTTRRFNPRQIKQAALTIGLLASLAIGVTTATIVRDTPEPASSTAAAVGAIATRNEMAGYTFREQNLYLPDGAVRPAATRYQRPSDRPSGSGT